MNIDRKSFFKIALTGIPAFGILTKTLTAFAEDEQGGDGAANAVLGELEFQNQFDGWIAPPQFGGKIKVLPLKDRHKEAKLGASAKLLRFDEGVIVPPHRHPEGEFTYVLSGSFSVEIGLAGEENEKLPIRTYEKGDYI